MQPQEYRCLDCGNEDQKRFYRLAVQHDRESPICDTCGNSITVYSKDKAEAIMQDAANFVQEMARKYVYAGAG